ncbi:hypothetical protein PS903_03400 [Pseudomonas fluorescens]|nr:hypothetical protein PS903_03400 [Pseudomonas fluorescens]
MITNFREIELCRYYYDPLDQQIGCTLAKQDISQRFYCQKRLATEIQGEVQTRNFQHDDQPLAQHRRQSGKSETSLLAVDQKKSVLNVLSPTRVNHPFAYTPYGHHQPGKGLLSLPGFNGECRDSLTGCYHLGHGYRQFNPLLMRFHSPDNMSPFGKGGLNAYAYCEGEPILRSDPDGHFFQSFFKFLKSYFVKPLRNFFTSRQSSSSVAKQMRSANVVRLDGQPIKMPVNMPDALGAAKKFGSEIHLRSDSYIKLNKVKLKMDRYTTGVEEMNLRLIKEQNWDPGISVNFKYQSHYAKGRPMQELLGAIKRMDAAELQNRMLSVRKPNLRGR